MGRIVRENAQILSGRMSPENEGQRRGLVIIASEGRFEKRIFPKKNRAPPPRSIRPHADISFKSSGSFSELEFFDQSGGSVGATGDPEALDEVLADPYLSDTVFKDQ
jgi:hypothetical protein